MTPWPWKEFSWRRLIKINDPKLLDLLSIAFSPEMPNLMQNPLFRDFVRQTKHSETA
jgi:hypothetical protein